MRNIVSIFVVAITTFRLDIVHSSGVYHPTGNSQLNLLFNLLWYLVLFLFFVLFSYCSPCFRCIMDKTLVHEFGNIVVVSSISFPSREHIMGKRESNYWTVQKIRLISLDDNWTSVCLDMSKFNILGCPFPNDHTFCFQTANDLWITLFEYETISYISFNFNYWQYSSKLFR